ncbi:MAG: methyltransferase domain-containing protein [Saprospiraceae bacterium]|nr:methyltransferase domain-containing protein [Saprospiraceae bacterium]
MLIRLLSLFLFLALLSTCEAQQKSASTSASASAQKTYTFRSSSRDGIGKYYFGREISHVMGHFGASWLERTEREQEENVSQAIENMKLKPNEVIADIGAGSGYYTFRMAKQVPEGKVLAVDIQPEMLDIMRQKIKKNKIKNVKLIQATEENPNLAKNSIDMAMMVDVYHELSYPKEVMREIVSALKPNGRFILLEYRLEDPKVPIKRLHKMSLEQAVTEMKAVGLKLQENIGNLPWQHFMVFVKE